MKKNVALVMQLPARGLGKLLLSEYLSRVQSWSRKKLIIILALSFSFLSILLAREGIILQQADGPAQLRILWLKFKQEK